MKDYEYWDVGEAFGARPPNLGQISTAKVMYAFVKLRGKLHNSCYQSWGPDQYRGVSYRISLPVGSEKEFEKMTGYPLTRPLKV